MFRSNVPALAAALLFTGHVAAQWSAAPSFPAGVDARAWPAGVRVGEAIYAIGGMPFSGGDENAVVHRLDSPDGAWATPLPIEGPIIRQGVGVDSIGQIIVFGGHDATDPEGDNGRHFVYADDEGQWYSIAERSAAAPASRFAFATDGASRIYSIGGGPGEAASAGDPNVAVVERYNGITDAWTVLPALPSARANSAAAADGAGRVYVSGGVNVTGSARLTDVDVFDVAGNTWLTNAVPDLPVAVSDHQMLVGPDDRLYVIGGRTGPIGAPTIEDRVWILDVGAAAWAPGPPLATERYGFAAVVGFDEFLYAMGGLTDSGATTSVERMVTPSCPVIALAPRFTALPWAGQTLFLEAAFAGNGPMTLQWSRDGVPLVDGPAPGGGVISGAETGALIITELSSADAGAYICAATNPCGTTTTDPVAFSVRTADPIPTQWTVTLLHPAGALSSAAHATDGLVQLGQIGVDNPDYGLLSQPGLWNGSSATWTNLTPAGSVGGTLNAGGTDVQVGWWWWPYQCQIGGTWYTCYERKGGRWFGTAESHEIMHASGWEYSSVADTDGTLFVGTLSDHDASGNTFAQAALFHGGYSTTALPDTGWPRTFASATDGGSVYGSGITPFPFSTRALMWPTAEQEPVNVHPAGANRSWLRAARDGQQLGEAAFGSSAPVSCLWFGSALGVRVFDSGPTYLYGLSEGFQVGSVSVDAAIFNGDPEVWVNIGAFLPAEYGNSSARGIHVAEDGTLTVVGTAYNTVAERAEAVLWRSSSAVIGDLDGDGIVGFSDLVLLLAQWGACAGCPADLDQDGTVGFADLLTLLDAWS